MALHRLDPSLLDVVPELAAFVPPARVFDKGVYSPWFEPAVHRSLQERCVDTLVSPGE